jgi:hypothetical protein
MQTAGKGTEERRKGSSDPPCLFGELLQRRAVLAPVHVELHHAVGVVEQRRIEQLDVQPAHTDRQHCRQRSSRVPLLPQVPASAGADRRPHEGAAEFRCRCGRGEPSPGADVGIR